MAFPFSHSRFRRHALIFSGCLVAVSGAWAQDAMQTPTADSNTAWPAYDWLKPAEEQQRAAASGESFTSISGQNVSDPFTVLSTGALWQDKNGELYTRQLDDAVTLSCASTTVEQSEDPNDPSSDEKLALAFQPGGELTLKADLHDEENDQPLLSDSTSTAGAGLAIESRLPTDATLSFGLRSDRTSADIPSYDSSATNAYDATVQQPLGKLP